MSRRIRVLVVDDSAFTRKVVREILEREGGIDVVGVARDGLEALEKIAQLAPDVLTLDLVMPNLDGVGVLRALPAENPPRVVIVSISDADTELGAEALQLGALDLVRKPTALATDQLYDIGAELVAKVRVAAASRAITAEPVPPPPAAPDPAPPLTATKDLIVIGTSTGGPQALTRLLTGLPANFPVPIAIALHIPAGYTEALARRLDESCAIDVVEARSGLVLTPGMATLARGGAHLTVGREEARPIARVGTHVKREIYCPSVDALFESAVDAFGPRVLGVVLTGMGDDGLRGSRAIRAAGGQVLTEAAASCVVYGMPRSVDEAGLSAGSARIDQMADLIVRHATGS